jgi:RNA polymerase sigma-70 factor (ECF subfamily)
VEERSMSVAAQKSTKGRDVSGLSQQAPPPFAEIFVNYAPFVWRVLRHLGVREADLPDLSQEVFVIIHKKIDTFNKSSTLCSWIYGICVRIASGYRRSARIRKEFFTDAVPERECPAQQISDLDNRRALEYLDSLLSELEPEKRMVYILYEIEELSMAEVAEAVNCPLSTAYSRLYAAREEIITADRRRQGKRRTP